MESIRKSIEEYIELEKNSTRPKRNINSKGLPINFDWRKKSRCKSISQIKKQTCGDCWVKLK